MTGMVCSFHGDEWSAGRRLPDGSYAYECARTTGHPAPGEWRWLYTPPPPGLAGLGGLAQEWNLEHELVEAVRDLGPGWWEYGLVERSYAARRPADFAEMVERWGHTAVQPKDYTATAYLGGVLGRMSVHGLIAFHEGAATGRWSYNSEISWWSLDALAPWEERTAWVDVVGDSSKADREADLACKAYVPGS